VYSLLGLNAKGVEVSFLNPLLHEAFLFLSLVT